jgi:hypothetical protein
MVNWSETLVILEGSRVKEAVEHMKEYVENDVLTPLNEGKGYSRLQITDIVSNGSSVAITGSGKWYAPYNYFISLSKEYNLSMKYYDCEPGADFFRKILVVDTKVTMDEQYEYWSIEHIKYEGVEWFLDELDNWYWVDVDEPIESIESLIDYFNINRPHNIEMYSTGE